MQITAAEPWRHMLWRMGAGAGCAGAHQGNLRNRLASRGRACQPGAPGRHSAAGQGQAQRRRQAGQRRHHRVHAAGGGRGRPAPAQGVAAARGAPWSGRAGTRRGGARHPGAFVRPGRPFGTGRTGRPGRARRRRRQWLAGMAHGLLQWRPDRARRRLHAAANADVAGAHGLPRPGRPGGQVQPGYLAHRGGAGDLAGVHLPVVVERHGGQCDPDPPGHAACPAARTEREAGGCRDQAGGGRTGAPAQGRALSRRGTGAAAARRWCGICGARCAKACCRRATIRWRWASWRWAPP